MKNKDVTLYSFNHMRDNIEKLASAVQTNPLQRFFYSADDAFCYAFDNDPSVFERISEDIRSVFAEFSIDASPTLMEIPIEWLIACDKISIPKNELNMLTTKRKKYRVAKINPDIKIHSSLGRRIDLDQPLTLDELIRYHHDIDEYDLTKFEITKKQGSHVLKYDIKRCKGGKYTAPKPIN